MNKTFMIQAINKAWEYQFLTYPNPAVGACIVKDNNIIALEAHEKAGKPHAEVNAFKSAFLYFYPNSKLKNIYNSYEIHNFLIHNHNNIFKELEIYVTLEPCNHIGKTPSCANLIKELQVKKVYIATQDTNNIASGGTKTLENANIDYSMGIEEKKAKELLFPFYTWQKNNFIFFKLAMRKDGSINNGYITTQDSLDLVHEIRTTIELLIIGGNTVRMDRPTLDARFSVSQKSPDILIYSNKKNFDKNIALFNIANRKVNVSNNINFTNSNFTMCEGGYELLKNISSKIDMLMLFVSHKDINNNIFDINTLGFKIIHSYFINKFDEIYFLMKK
jgi:diaminohydroxyphosphoribosylaminopyrimidine deaminase/5-amino-6-(5-phosphoribosylamino)uracil reductase